MNQRITLSNVDLVLGHVAHYGFGRIHAFLVITRSSFIANEVPKHVEEIREFSLQRIYFLVFNFWGFAK
jgi:predicted membrane metal-binding protein